MKTFLALEISDHKIRYVVLDKEGKDIVFKQAGESTLEVGPSAPGALSGFIHRLIAQENLKISRIFLSLNRHDTVIHQLKLATTAKADLEVIIPAEIEKIPSFAETSFDYVYKDFDGEVPSKSRVVFAAVGNDLLQYLIKEIQETQVPCQEMDICPLNLAGLLPASETTQALTVLSDRLTHVVIFKNQQIKYVYTTNSGKADLFDDGHANEPACQGWVEELGRVLKSYSLDQKQVLEKNWLVWDTDRAEHFDEFLAKEFDFPVQKVTILADIFLQEVNIIYLLAVVPAFYFLTNITPSFSLKHFFRASHARQIVRQALVGSMAALVCSLVILGGVFFHFYSVQQKTQAAIQAIEQKIQVVQARSPEIFKLRDEYAKAREQLLLQATYVKLLNRMSWSETLSAVASELPEDLSLTSFKVDESGTATFTGEAFDMDSIAALLRKVESSSILERGKFSYLNEEEIQKKKIFRFGILAKLKAAEKSHE